MALKNPRCQHLVVSEGGDPKGPVLVRSSRSGRSGTRREGDVTTSCSVVFSFEGDQKTPTHNGQKKRRRCVTQQRQQVWRTILFREIVAAASSWLLGKKWQGTRCYRLLGMQGAYPKHTNTARSRKTTTTTTSTTSKVSENGLFLLGVVVVLDNKWVIGA